LQKKWAKALHILRRRRQKFRQKNPPDGSVRGTSDFLGVFSQKQLENCTIVIYFYRNKCIQAIAADSGELS